MSSMPLTGHVAVDAGLAVRTPRHGVRCVRLHSGGNDVWELGRARVRVR